MKSAELDIVLPCYNPLPDWENTIIHSISELNKRLPNTTIYLYIVNDGSNPDLSNKSIEKISNAIPNFEYISYTDNQGKGFALRKGVAQTEHNLCIYTDVDFPYTLDSFIKVYNKLVEKKVDVVVAVRDNNYYKDVPKFRVLISKFLKFLIKSFLNISIDDTQGGLKGFNKKGKSIFLETTINSYLFDLEFIYLASNRKDINISPVEVELKPNIVFSNMNLKILFSEGLSFLKLLLK